MFYNLYSYNSKDARWSVRTGLTFFKISSTPHRKNTRMYHTYMYPMMRRRRDFE